MTDQGMNSADPVVARVAAVVGPAGILTDADDMAPYLVSWRDNYVGQARAVVRPATSAEVADVVRICAETKTAIVPQSGNTGLTGAGIPHDSGDEILLSLNRMTRIREVDPINDTMTVEAGCILAEIQAAAAEADRLFPLSLGAEGTCRIGGNLSTNAGGVHVVRYGNARALVLGLEVVLPDGRIWDGLKTLRKDNTGYDLKQLFIGAEGTLGIITAAVLKLFPRPRDMQTVFAATDSPDTALSLLNFARERLGEALSVFELIPRFGLDLVLDHVEGNADPLAEKHPWYILMECGGQSPDGALREQVEAVLAEAMDAGWVRDAVLAASQSQAASLWRLREDLALAQNPEGGSIKHDISVPVSKVPEFLRRADAALVAAYPGIRPLGFGHLGDGNMHYNPAQPVGMNKAAFLALTPEVNRIVHDIAVGLGGSISAEHGIGRRRRGEARHYKSDVEMDLMQRVKAAIDPTGIMNPGKVL